MKRIFTLCVAVLIVFTAFGQRRLAHRDVEHPSAKLSEVTQMEVIGMPAKVSPSSKTATLAVDEMLVGKTMYDLQTNNALSNRVHRYDNGQLVATWTGGVVSPGTGATDFPDRGSFYNYFTGTNWAIADPGLNDITRIEDNRSGWPSYAPFGNGEMIASHATGVSLYTRDQVGTGAWRKTAVVNSANSWPRICIHNGVIHILSIQQVTQPSPLSAKTTLYYSRSKDGGETWEPSNERIYELGETFYNDYAFSADGYVWAEPRNGMIAFSLASSRADLLIMKSTDDGDSWQKIVVWQHPIPFQNPDLVTQADYPDTLFCPNGAQSLVIDHNGKCHLTFNTYQLHHDEEGLKYFVYYSHAMYWNEYDMGPFTNSNQFRALDPEWNEAYFTDGRLLLAYGFDFSGDGYPHPVNGTSPLGAAGYRNGGLIPNTTIAVAGPNRVIIALEVQDETAPLYNDAYMYCKIFLCSYTYSTLYEEWLFDPTWIVDPNMKSYDLYTDPPQEMSNAGWFRMNYGFVHERDNCVYPQILVQETANDKGNMYVFFNVDEMPGELIAVSNYNPQHGIATENSLVMWTQAVDFSGGNIPEITLGIDNHKEANKELLVYPNPANNMVNIVVEENVNCVIYNMAGQAVAKQALIAGNNTVDISNMKAGVYFISAGNSNAKLVVK